MLEESGVLSDQDMFDLLQDSYRRSPRLYVEQVLGKKLWKRQLQITLALMEKKRVFVQASHAVGKSFVAASLVNWHYDSFDPGITITTAPSKNQVERVLWKEVRMQRGDRGGQSGLKPSAPMIGDYGTGHFAIGMTAKDDTGFQGSHEENIFGVFDEAVGIEGPFWDGMEGMMTGGDGNLWLAICNPTDTSSRAYQEVQGGGGGDEFSASEWYVMDISAMEHPNIQAAIKGEPLPFPKAVQISYIDRMVRKFSEEIDPADMRSGDFYWALPRRDGSRDAQNPQAYRPGPMMETRVLGRWASNLTSSIWSDSMWKAAERRLQDRKPSDPKTMPLPDDEVYSKPLQIGCDVAWGGSDYTSIVARRGGAALHWETHNGWRPPQIAAGIKKAVRKLVDDRTERYRHLPNFVAEDPKRVLIVLDHDATGNAVLDYLAGWNVVTQSGMSPSLEEDGYPNRRSEIWFDVADLADRNRLDFSRLSTDALMKLRSQAVGPKYAITSRGREVEPKDKTRKRLKRSPDDMDALNLAFCQPSSVVMRMPVSVVNGRVVGKGAGLVQDAGLRLTDPVQSHRRVSPLSGSGLGPLTGEFAEENARRVIAATTATPLRVSGVRKPSRRLS